MEPDFEGEDTNGEDTNATKMRRLEREVDTLEDSLSQTEDHEMGRMPIFHIGNWKAETPGQKRRRLRKIRKGMRHKYVDRVVWMKNKKLKVKQKQKIRRKPFAGQTEYERECIHWRVLPNHACPSIRSVFMVDLLEGNTYLKKLESLEQYLKPYTPCSFLKGYTPPFSTITIDICAMFEESRILIEKNQKVRMIMKQFLTKWRLKRHTVINDTDVVTMNPIKKPVYLHSFPGKCVYVFEADSVMKDIHKKLLHNDGEFPDPIFPKNMFTNETLTKGQLWYLVQQCKAQGKTTWAIESFFELGFDISKFLTFNRKKLRMVALKNVMQDPKSLEYFDMMYDFITSQHDANGKKVDTELYSWAIRRVPEDPLMVQWRTICKEWYERDILLDDPHDKNYNFFRVMEETSPLCEKPTSLIKKFRRYQKQSTYFV